MEKCESCEYKIAMDNVSGELPEKRNIDGVIYLEGKDRMFWEGFNQAIDLCKPILAKWIACKKRYQDSLGERTGELMTLQDDLAKKELKIKNLEEDNKFLLLEALDASIEDTKYFEQELATLKNSNEQLQSWVNDHPEIKKLKEELKRLEGVEDYVLSTEQENAELKAELEEATTTIGDLRIKGFERLEYCTKLQQENAKLKEEVETVRLESYGEALKNKKLRELAGIAAKELNGLVDILEKHKLVQPKP